MVLFDVISTGSQGNAVVLNNNVLVDCGIPFRNLYPYVPGLRLVLLTHIHSDHFRVSTIKRLAAERPTLRFGCCPWMVMPLLSQGVSERNIDVMDFGMTYKYDICHVIPVPLKHDVPNCGYKIHFNNGKVIYATDTNNLDGISAPNYDLYLIEANYEDDAIRERIAEKKAAGEFAYEKRVLNYHLSKAKCDDFIYRNIGPNGRYVYLHRHTEFRDGETVCEVN